MADLKGKVAWVTGAGTGIGEGAALALARDGAVVVLTGRRAETLRAVADKITKAGGKAVQPWDEKGFRIPGGDPYSTAGGQVFVAGNAMLHAKTMGNYPAPEAIMSAVYEGLLVPMDAALRIEARYMTKVMMHPASRNMIRSLFINMQKANKLERRPKDAPKTKLDKIGVLGAGMMGAGIAYVSAVAGLEVVLIDRSLEDAEKGKGYSAKLLAKQVERGRMKQDAADAVLARITPATEYDGLKDADFVIEAVFEDRAIKADVTKKTAAVLPAGVPFASNTSTLPITGLAEAWRDETAFIGVHFFSPVDKMQLVEIIRGKKTSDATLAVAMDYVQRIKKTPIVVNDSRGFFTSRVFATYTGEGMRMLAEGINPALIENAGKMTSMPMPPLALSDEVALDLIYKIGKQTAKDMGAAYKPSPIDPMIEKLVVQLGRLGKKAGKGFYDYPADGKKRLWPGLAELAPRAAEQPSVDELKKRFLYIQALETARCYEEKVLTAPEDADVGAILGWGFAPWSGGPLSLIDTVGLKAFVAECDRMAQAYGFAVTGVELSERRRRYAQSQGLRALAELTACERFDFINCQQVLEHLPDPGRALSELRRVLAPRGRLIVSAPHLSRLHELPHDYFRYTPNGLRALLDRAGFTEAEVGTYGGPFSFLHHQSSFLFPGLVAGMPAIGAGASAFNAMFSLVFAGLDRIPALARLLPLGVIAIARA